MKKLNEKNVVIINVSELLEMYYNDKTSGAIYNNKAIIKALEVLSENGFDNLEFTLSISPKGLCNRGELMESIIKFYVLGKNQYAFKGSADLDTTKIDLIDSNILKIFDLRRCKYEIEYSTSKTPANINTSSGKYVIFVNDKMQVLEIESKNVILNKYGKPLANQNGRELSMLKEMVFGRA